jgi:hypothetical protein
MITATVSSKKEVETVPSTVVVSAGLLMQRLAFHTMVHAHIFHHWQTIVAVQFMKFQNNSLDVVVVVVAVEVVIADHVERCTRQSVHFVRMIAKYHSSLHLENQFAVDHAWLKSKMVKQHLMS